MADEWPLRDFIEFGALPGAVPCARLHARLLLAEWGLSGRRIKYRDKARIRPSQTCLIPRWPP